MNYYQILGLRSDASEASVRRAFRYHAKRCHPDVSPGESSKQEFQKINEAYQVLKDANRRRLYDIRLARGTLSRRVYYRPAATRSQTRSGYHYKGLDNEPGDEKLERTLDRVLFFSLLMLGLAALFAGIYRAFVEPVEGVNPLLGIAFGIIFTGLLVFVWDKMHRLKADR